MEQSTKSTTSLDSNATDLDNCSKEPIHIPKLIQGHGYLLVLDSKLETILELSENTSTLFSTDLDSIYREDINTLLGFDIKSIISDKEKSKLSSLHYQEIKISSKNYELIIHKNSQDLFIFELNELSKERQFYIEDFHFEIIKALGNLPASLSEEELYETITNKIQKLTNLDRVMLYKFLPDLSGEVVAETRKKDQANSYMGLRFPASDIPRQARVLYTQNKIRLITDIDSNPTPLLARNNNQAETDLSHAHLRSVSPIHIEYLKNMGVQSSLSISITKDGQLWGLIACHHSSPYRLSHKEQIALELAGKVFEAEILKKEDQNSYAIESQARERAKYYLDKLSQANDFRSFFTHNKFLVNIFKDTTAAIVFKRNSFSFIGDIKDSARTHKLGNFIKAQLEKLKVFSTDSISEIEPNFKDIAEWASGILAVKLFEDQDDYIAWIKPEIVTVIRWAGDPYHKTLGEDGKIHPRTSFESWQEENRFRSAPWDLSMIKFAIEIKDNISKLLLSDRIKRSNIELENFTSIISHDLKEPIRNIQTFASLILDEELSDENRSILDKISNNAELFQNMITRLREYSKVSKLDLAYGEIDMNQVIGDTLVSLESLLRENNVEINVKYDFPITYCDTVKVRHIFYNLIANGIKYNNKELKKIEIGCIQKEKPYTFFVKDNGIGVEEMYQEDIFRIFRRIPNDLKTEGSGMGLSITQKIIERHGGKLWLESKAGEGSTFFFTLS